MIGRCLPVPAGGAPCRVIRRSHRLRFENEKPDGWRRRAFENHDQEPHWFRGLSVPDLPTIRRYVGDRLSTTRRIASARLSLSHITLIAPLRQEATGDACRE